MGGVRQRQGPSGSYFGSLVRRKHVDSVLTKSESHDQLAKELSIPYLIAIGVGSTIGAGVYILVGTVAREHSGPLLAMSFLVAGIAAGLSALCYAELASRCPSAGSAYHYSYVCVGEGIAWLVGWSMILEYTIGGAAVARGISPNLALLFGGPDSLPFFLSRQHIPGIDIVVDPCGAILIFVMTGLLCVGIKESSLAQAFVTIVNIGAMTFVIVAGSYLGFKTGWTGYEVTTGYFPFGIDGVLAGSATVFFAYIGFDSVASCAEEVKNPQRDLPLGIGAALSICCALYMLVSVVIVGLVPYYVMDPDTPISSAFADHGMQWAANVITIGASTALCSTLMGSLLPQPRILLAMSRDGLLPPFFSEVNKHTQVPVKGTIATGIVAAVLAFIMEVSDLAGMVSVGTLLAFTMVAISVLILRYVPPDEVPFPSSFQESIDSVSLQYGKSTQEIIAEKLEQEGIEDPSMEYLLMEMGTQGHNIVKEEKRRKVAGWTIMLTCIGVFLLAYAASDMGLPRYLYYASCGVGGALLLLGLVILTILDQDDARHSFGHAGVMGPSYVALLLVQSFWAGEEGLICPFVPLLPIASILINVYLLINLGAATWIRVCVWLLVGAIVYVFYGRRNSSLLDAVYVPVAHSDEIYRCSASSPP